MTTPRDRDADKCLLRSLHQAQQKVGLAALAIQNHRATEAGQHLVAVQRELMAVERSLAWPGGLPE